MACFEEDNRISQKMQTLHLCWCNEYRAFHRHLTIKFGNPFDGGITDQEMASSIASFEASKAKFLENSTELARVCRMYASAMEAMAGGDKDALERFLNDARQLEF